ncbi:MAG: hypothetical protein ABIY55_29610, partial [Kofleriaceae bacterium]
QMANRPPLAGMSPSGLLDASAGSLPATIPGGQAAPMPGRAPRLPFSSYPPGTAEIPTQRAPTSTRQPVPQPQPQLSREQMTAQVVPIPHANGQPALMPPPGYGPPPPISRQAKMVLAGVGLAVFAAVATIAIIKGARGAVEQQPVPAPSAPIAPAPAPPKAAVVAPRPVKPATAPAPTTTAPTPTTTAPTAPVARVAPPPTTATPPPTTTVTTTAPTTAPPPTTTVTTTAPTTAPPPPTTVTTTAPPATSPPVVHPPVVRPPVAPQVATSTQAVTTPPITAPPTPARVPTPPPVALRKPDKKPDRKPDKKPEVAVVDNTDKPDPPRGDKRRGHTIQDVKSDANGLYRAKNFGGAAALITSALPSFGGGDAQELRSIAAIYSQLGKAYNVGTAPGTKPTEAYQALHRATSYDRDVGSAYVAELQEHLVTVATRAAVSYMASKEYEAAFQAVRTSESLGSSSSSNKAVRDRLEAFAAEIYRAAQTDLASDPEGAKKKLRQILGMVDPKHPLYSKAQKLLNAP